MRLVNIDLGINIEIEENRVYEIVIENRTCFADTGGMLAVQTQGGEGDFVLSENNKELKLDKVVELIVDYFSFSPNDRRTLNRLYSVMEQAAQEHFEDKAVINEKMVNLLDDISISMGYNELKYELDFKWTDIFKMFGVGFVDEYSSLSEKLTNYIKVVSELTDIRLIVLVNIRSYLQRQELVNLYDMASYYKVNLFLIEPSEYPDRERELRYIIDKDLCMIDAN